MVSHFFYTAQDKELMMSQLELSFPNSTIFALSLSSLPQVCNYLYSVISYNLE